MTDEVDGGHPVERKHIVRLMPAEQGLDACPKALVAAAGAEDVGLPLAGVVELQGLHEDRPLSHTPLPLPEDRPRTSRHHPMRVSGGASATGPDYFPESAPAEHLLAEPGPGVGPTAVGGPGRQAQGLGGLVEGQAGEVSQLHQLGRVLVLRGELLQGLVQGEQIVDRRGDGVPRVVEVHPMPVAAVLRASFPAGAVDRGSAASPRPRRRRSGPGRPRACGPRRPPAAGTPRAPGPWPGASGRASPGPACRAASLRSSS